MGRHCEAYGHLGEEMELRLQCEKEHEFGKGRKAGGADKVIAEREQRRCFVCVCVSVCMYNLNVALHFQSRGQA